MRNNRVKNLDQVFAKPDHWLASFNLESEKVIGRVKDNKGLIETIPHPKTNFRFNDIVEVEGPVGTSIYRDEQIPVFNVLKILNSSQVQTFSFEAIVPTSNDWFDLSSVFNRQNTFMRFPYQENYPVKHWETGYCVASSIKEAESIFEEFIVSGKDRKVKNIVDVFDKVNSINGELIGEKFYLELKYPKNVTTPTLIICFLPLILFSVLAMRVGINNTSDIIRFIFALFLFGCLETYLFLRLNRYRIALNRNGLLATYPFGKEKRLSWDDVKEVKYSRNKTHMVLRNKDGIKIRVSKLFNNFNRFCIVSNNLIKNKSNKKIF
jgi:hypothetical protein